MTTEPTREEIWALLVRTEIALSAALNLVDGDGCPPDWGYLRLVKSQLAALTSRPAPSAVHEQRQLIGDAIVAGDKYGRLSPDDVSRIQRLIIDALFLVSDSRPRHPRPEGGK